jgi:hypothetical protein
MATFRITSMRGFLKPVVLLALLQISACSTESNSTGTVVIPNVVGWTAPAQREDGSLLNLSDIAGYKVYYGAMQGVYTDTIDITDGSAVQTEMPTLTAGTYHVVVTTIDLDGRESQYSQEVILTI